jgi:hypothetical protein
MWRTYSNLDPHRSPFSRLLQQEKGMLRTCLYPDSQGLRKTNTMLTLMHQMRISTNKVSSVMLRPKKLEIRIKSVKTIKIQFHYTTSLISLTL